MNEDLHDDVTCKQCGKIGRGKTIQAEARSGSPGEKMMIAVCAAPECPSYGSPIG